MPDDDEDSDEDDVMLKLAEESVVYADGEPTKNEKTAGLQEYGPAPSSQALCVNCNQEVIKDSLKLKYRRRF